MADSLKIKIDGDDSGFKDTLSKIGTMAKSVMKSVATTAATAAATTAATLGKELANVILTSDNIANQMLTTKTSISDLASSFGEQFMPMATEAFGAVSGEIGNLESALNKGGIKGLALQLGDSLANIGTYIADMVPEFVDLAVSIIESLLTGLTNNVDRLVEAAVRIVLVIVKGIIDLLPKFIELAVQLINALVTGIGLALPELIPVAVTAIMTIVQGLVDNLPMILDASLQLILGLAQGLIDAIPQLIEALPAIITSLVDFINSSIPQIIEAGIQLLTSLITALPEIINAIVTALPQIISSIESALLGNIDTIAFAGVQLFISLIANLPAIIGEIIKAAPQIIDGIINAFINLTGKMVEIGGNIVKGLWDGIVGLASWLWDQVSGWISGIWDGICSFFGIKSPSKEMAWIGEMLVKGLANSIDNNGDEAVKAAEVMSENINNAMKSNAIDTIDTIETGYESRARTLISKVGNLSRRAIPGLELSKGDVESIYATLGTALVPMQATIAAVTNHVSGFMQPLQSSTTNHYTTYESVQQGDVILHSTLELDGETIYQNQRRVKDRKGIQLSTEGAW